MRQDRMLNEKIVILFLASDPTDATRLRLGEELREIQERLQLAKLRDRFDLHQRMSVRPTDITQALLDTQPQIVHFSGHGVASGQICFENVHGHSHPVTSEAMATLFEQFKSHVNCVVLNACFSDEQAKAITKHVDYAIGINDAIGDRAAIAFAVGFYQALGAGRTIEDGYNLGCTLVRLQGISEDAVPVLLKRSDQSNSSADSKSPFRIDAIKSEMISIYLLISTGEMYSVEVPHDVSAMTLKLDIVEQVKPVKDLYDSARNPATRSYLEVIGDRGERVRRLKDDMTLRQNQVQNGDTVVFVVESIAG